MLTMTVLIVGLMALSAGKLVYYTIAWAVKRPMIAAITQVKPEMAPVIYQCPSLQ